MCGECKNLAKEGGLTCRAFPEGIPQRILLNDHDHRKPFKGDNGILFDPIDPDNVGQYGSPILAGLLDGE